MQSTLLRLAMPLVFLSSGAARAQEAPPVAEARPTSERPVAPMHTMGQALDSWISTAEHEIVDAADAMPEQTYRFAPTAGAFTGVRTFGQQVKHLAANNYRMAAYILTRTPTPDQTSETGPDSIQSKAQILDYLKGSFVLLHEAVATVNPGNMLEPLTAAPSARQRTRLQLAVDAVAHSYDHYGQMVEYLRMNGIVPPASR